MANATLLALINIAAEQAAISEPISVKTVLLYLLAFGIFYVANKASLRKANQFMQERLGALRLRIADKIQKSNLRTLERLDHGSIFSTLSQEMNHFSHHFTLLSSAAQSLVLLLLCLVYIAFLSLVAFFLVAGATSLALFYFWKRRQALTKAMESVNAHESNMLGSLQNYIEGFQEIRINADKNDALHSRFKTIVYGLERVLVGIGGKWVVLLLFSNAFLYFLVGVVVFILPLFFQGYTDTVYKIVTASIFLVGPVSAVTSAAPIFVKANIGLGHVFELERNLERSLNRHAPKSLSDEDIFHGFNTITLDDVQFSYRDSDDIEIFTAGPWKLDIQRGECLFLMGGNGSGKSTALKLISGLYAGDKGQILVDGTPVQEKSLPAYRALFSCIFPDFYLFDKLYGLRDVAPEKVDDLIRWMQLEEKVSFTQDSFSTHDLSTGQRKRLAMIVSLLEDREVYLFDEWAADQDSYFREIFYTEILPKLKAAKKTVIVVTHDDRYWHLCDRSITLDIGVMTEGTQGTSFSSQTGGGA